MVKGNTILKLNEGVPLRVRLYVTIFCFVPPQKDFHFNP